MGQYYDILIQRKRSAHYDRSVDGNYMMAKLTEHSWWANDTMGAICRIIHNKPARVFWVGDYADDAESVNELTKDEIASVYKKCWGNKALKDRTLSGRNLVLLDGKFLVNHTKLEYIDCDKYFQRSKNKSGWVMHPLSLLTAIGNGLGGGDYHGINEDRVGSWAGDCISVKDKRPLGWPENDVVFMEDW